MKNPSHKILKHQIKVRLRYLKRRFWRIRRLVYVWVLVRLFRFQQATRAFGSRIYSYIKATYATLTSILIAVALLVFLPEFDPNNVNLKISEVHFASAGIIGTALALVMTLSVIPAQKAADVFSSAVLRLYASDAATIIVFATLAIMVVLSLLLGLGWDFGLSTTALLAAQFVILGVALDALRQFYARTLELLVPTTALLMVRKYCGRIIENTRSTIKKAAHINRLSDINNTVDDRVRKWSIYRISTITGQLNSWISQLEEFAYKATLRSDIQAARAVIQTIRLIGTDYAESRRDSIVVQADWGGGFPIGTSDLSEVLNPIQESLRGILDKAIDAKSESLVIECVNAYRDLALHALTLVHTDQLAGKSAPLAYSPVFYIKICSEKAASADMEDALLACVRAIGVILANLPDGVPVTEMQATAMDCLSGILLNSYVRKKNVSGSEAAQMMLIAAQKDLQVHGLQPTAVLKKVMRDFEQYMPLEVVADKTGQRTLQVFPAYSMGFQANLPTLLAESGKRVQPVDPERPWVDPFSEFAEVSRAIVHHYRNLAKNVKFEGTLLQKWILDSITTAVHVHIDLLDDLPPGCDSFQQTVVDRMLWFVHAPGFFFGKPDEEFPKRHADDVSGRLAIVGMRLLTRGNLAEALECAKAINSIGEAAAAKQIEPYGLADIMVNLEQLARAIEARGFTAESTPLIANVDLPAGVNDDYRDAYIDAIASRRGHLDRNLRNHSRDISLPDDPTPHLKRILEENERS